jgi:hypothetical protein
VFLDAIVDMKDDYVYMPKNITESNRVSSCYGVAGLPDCCGSIDVVHVKWSNCPAGDFNRAKGKETFPSLGFECITDFNRRVLCLNNFMLDLMDRTNSRVGRGAPMGDDGICLSGPRDVEPEETDRVLSTQFDQRRNLLVNHLYLFRKKGNISGLN